MTAMFGMMLGIIDDAYATNAVLQPNGLALALQPGFVQKAFNYKKKIDIVMMLAWATILCVKLSYLFLFRRLIDRLRYMTVYWWVIFIFIIGTSGYVFAIYYLVCPYYDDFRASKLSSEIYFETMLTCKVQCVTGDGISRTIQYTIIQISLDIIGDILSTFIPLHSFCDH